MEEKFYKITLSGDTEPVPGCERLSEEEMEQWLSENQVHYDEPAENGDTVKYIRMVLNNE